MSVLFHVLNILFKIPFGLESYKVMNIYSGFGVLKLLFSISFDLYTHTHLFTLLT